jgi:uncharacterized protein DUF5972
VLRPLTRQGRSLVLVPIREIGRRCTPMRTYERPTLRTSGSFIKKTGVGSKSHADLVVLSHRK